MHPRQANQEEFYNAFARPGADTTGLAMQLMKRLMIKALSLRGRERQHLGRGMWHLLCKTAKAKTPGDWKLACSGGNAKLQNQ